MPTRILAGVADPFIWGAFSLSIDRKYRLLITGNSLTLAARGKLAIRSRKGKIWEYMIHRKHAWNLYLMVS
jgi:hypothetical protein